MSILAKLHCHRTFDGRFSLIADIRLTVRFVPEADIFFEPELAKFCQNQNR